MTTLYIAVTYGDSIENIEATRVTEACYFALDDRGQERRHSLEGSNFKVFKEHAAAVAWLRTNIEQDITSALKKFEYRMNELNLFNEKYPQL